MKLTAEQIYRLALGALPHDLGLRHITVPYINCDINELSEAEAFEYRKHPILAYSVLEEENGWILCKKIVLVHHERRDGSGFPLKQKKRGIRNVEYYRHVMRSTVLSAGWNADV